MTYTNTPAVVSQQTTSYSSGNIPYTSIALLENIPHSAQLEVERIFVVDRDGSAATLLAFLADTAVTTAQKKAVFIIPISRCTLNTATKNISAINLPASGDVYNYVITTPTPTTYTIKVPILSSSTVTVRRKTVSNEPLVNWVSGSRLTSKQLNLSATQSLYLIQEALENIGTSLTIQTTQITATSLATDAVNTINILNGAVTSAKIADGTIVNADINASAGIVDTKLATIATAGKVSNSATTATTSTTAATIALRDSNGVVSSAFIQTGTGATARTVDAKLKDTVSVKDFGAVGDGVADDTAALVLAAAALTNNQTLYFEKGTYLISYSGATTHQSGAAFGKVVMALTGLSNIIINGNGSIIKINNHNCSTGGLTFLNLKSCQRFTIRGFDFDMTFTGVNTSALVYPFCGAITALDDSAAGQTQSQLCGDALIENCKFKLFHPYGSVCESGSPYAGDPYNGFKIFSIFTSGPYLATAYEEQCRNVTIKGCVFKDGHNAYGIWNWAWNNILITENIAENYVSKFSNQTGAYVGSGLPMCRYMQWHCSGYTVSNNKFRAKPSSERTVSGFEGSSRFCYVGTNLTGDYSHGLSSIENNLIIAGNGDSAHSEFDWLIEVAAYGSINISNNIFDGQVSASNNYGSKGIITVGEANGGNGKSALVISDNTWGSQCSYMDNIVIANSDNTSASNRRIKSLTISDNTSLSQLQYFCNMTGNSTSTYPGCENVLIDSNVIVGSYNTVFNSANTSSRAFLLASSPTSDVLHVTNNIVRDKNYFAIDISISSTATTLINNNNNYGVTTILFSGVTATNHLTKSGTFIPAFSATGSTFAYATNGQVGRYTRNGNRINFSITLILATSGNTLAANTLTITGLPFASVAASNTAYASTCLWAAITTPLVNMQSEIGASSFSMKLFKTTAASVSSATAMVATDLHATNGSVIEITGCYEMVPTS